MIRIHGEKTQRGLHVVVQDREYSIQYPEEIWSAVPERVSDVLLDNLVYASTLHLSMVYDATSIVYETHRPILETFFFQNFIKDIPSCCDMSDLDTNNETVKFVSTGISFAHNTIRRPSVWKSAHQQHQSIVPMSFGKDSLLTFAMCHELGHHPIPVFVNEPSFSNERHHKEILGKDFAAEFGISLLILEHDIGLLRDWTHLQLPESEYGWGLQSTEYALMMLPYAKYYGAKYILFGNEQSASSSYVSDGWTVYPCYDQTHIWTQHISTMTSLLTLGEPVQTSSIIEPLMDMIIQRMLVRRYPQFAKYQMSCFANGENGLQSRWCHDCSICAKMYLLCRGGNVNPYMVGFTESMLTANKKHLFPLLGGFSEFPYARTTTARDEQIFAFHCATHFGCQEELVQEFAASPLAQEGHGRATELLHKFVQVYPSICIDEELLSQLQPIYTEEIQLFTQEYQAYENRIDR